MPHSLKKYKSPHQRDIMLGSLGSNPNNMMARSWLGTPHQTTNEVIHWARMATKGSSNNIAFMILNYKDWSPQKLTLIQQDIHTIATIPPNALRYTLEPQWPTYYNKLELSLTTIICKHSLDTPPVEHTFVTQLQQAIQDKYNLNIPTHNPKTTLKP